MRKPISRLRAFVDRTLRHRESARVIDSEEYWSLLERTPADWLALGAKPLSSAAVRGLARRGTVGQLDWDELLAHVAAERDAPAEWRTEELVAAGLLAGVITPGAESYERAARVIAWALPFAQPADWAPETRMLAFQAAVLAGADSVCDSLAQYAEKLPGVIWAGRTDGLLPRDGELGVDSAGDLTGPTAKWWRAVNEPFVQDGLEPWELTPEPGNELPFRWIHAPVVGEASIPAAEQPLVSVIVPVYNPDAGLLATIESLSRQSWRNLEIIVVDDASTTGAEFIAASVALDSRVRLIEMPRNSGAYVARNAGFASASGEFVTVLDADDLSHPRRIEYQTVPLVEHPEKHVTGVAGIRIFADGVLTMYGFYSRRRNYSAFLFRREPVLAALGRFDDVRKSGDVEFLGRLERVLGSKAIHRVGKHLGITQLTPGSLSRNDIRFVWLAGDRVGYLEQYRGWHRRSAPEQLKLEASAPRPFIAPARFIGEAPREHYECAVLRDWSGAVDGPSPTELLALVPVAHGPIGLVNGVHPRLSAAGRLPVADETWAAVESRAAEWLPWGRDAVVDTLIVASPEYLFLLPDREYSGLTVRRIVVLGSSEIQLDTESVVLDQVALSREVFARFGVSAEWAD
ncbi:glycosyltransferase family A protein [Leucobacter luti]|uniref:glycosyltransferase family A protein n=1 Tax=Leucobacter luti TaxID=340320 RepID=UPI001404788E|nr:glycosyltransferase family A protein [Leucobacter luti]MCW2289844.1 hypothetical protein [Leucobacter luti]